MIRKTSITLIHNFSTVDKSRLNVILLWGLHYLYLNNKHSLKELQSKIFTSFDGFIILRLFERTKKSSCDFYWI